MLYSELAMTPKEIITAAARSLRLDRTGVCSTSFPPLLKEQLIKAGPVPFAPADPEERLHPEKLLPGCRSFFVILFPYRTEDKAPGNISLYARPRDYHRIIQSYLERIIEKIRPLWPDEKFLPLADTSPMADRFLAYSAGLGFYGVNHLLINPKYGSYCTIGSILTTLDLPADTPLKQSCLRCGACIRCCPGRAIRENRYLPLRCKSYLTQKKEDLTKDEEKIISGTPLIFGCDACQTCCPHNRHAAFSPLPEMKEARISSLSDELLTALSNRGFDKQFKEYAFQWRGKKVLLRNLQILRGSQDPDSRS